MANFEKYLNEVGPDTDFDTDVLKRLKKTVDNINKSIKDMEYVFHKLKEDRQKEKQVREIMDNLGEAKRNIKNELLYYRRDISSKW